MNLDVHRGYFIYGKVIFSMIMKNIFLDNAQNAITSAAWFLWQR